MEPLWSPVVATGGNRSQIEQAQEPPKQAKTVAVGCDQLRFRAHGKEAVPGSSPGEGLNTCKSALSEDSRVPLVQGGTRTSGGPEAENSPQIRLFAESAEHLPEREGLDVVAEAVSSESRWKRDNRRRAVWRGEAWGQVLGTERAVRTCARFRKSLASRRVLSESTNSSM